MSAAAAVVVAAIAAAAAAVTAAEIAQQEDQDDDPPPVIAAEAVADAVIVTHRSPSGIQIGSGLHCSFHGIQASGFCAGEQPGFTPEGRGEIDTPEPMMYNKLTFFGNWGGMYANHFRPPGSSPDPGAAAGTAEDHGLPE